MLFRGRQAVTRQSQQKQKMTTMKAQQTTIQPVDEFLSVLSHSALSSITQTST